MDYRWQQGINKQPAVDNAALEKELRQNEQRIAELRVKLNQARDDMDRELAANRAGIGDIGTSQSHQKAIEDRGYRWAMGEQARQAQMLGDNKARTSRKGELEEQLEQAYYDLATADANAKVPVQNRIKRLERDYKGLTGKDYEYAGEQVATGQVQAGDEVNDIVSVRSKIATMKGSGNYVTESQKAELLSDLKNVPISDESVALYNEIVKMPTKEKVNAAAGNRKAKANKAIDEVVGTISNRDFAKNKGKVTRTTKDGHVVTVEKIGDNSVRYTCNGVSRTEGR